MSSVAMAPLEGAMNQADHADQNYTLRELLISQEPIGEDLEAAEMGTNKPTLSPSEKRRLVKWDLGDPMAQATPPPVHPHVAPQLKAWQQLTGALRRSFGGAHNPEHHPRPRSLGLLNFSSLFDSLSSQAPTTSHNTNPPTSTSHPSAFSDGIRTASTDPSAPEGVDLSQLQKRVPGRSQLPEGYKDGLFSLPPRELDHYSSLRVKRSGERGLARHLG